MTAIQPRHQPRRARLVGAFIAVALIGVGVTGLDGPAASSERDSPPDLVQIVAGGDWQS